jgi:hypothetical protein
VTPAASTILGLGSRFGGVESKAKNSKVAHEHTEHREHDKFILVRASRE